MFALLPADESESQDSGLLFPDPTNEELSCTGFALAPKIVSCPFSFLPSWLPVALLSVPGRGAPQEGQA